MIEIVGQWQPYTNSRLPVSQTNCFYVGSVVKPDQQSCSSFRPLSVSTQVWYHILWYCIGHLLYVLAALRALYTITVVICLKQKKIDLFCCSFAYKWKVKQKPLHCLYLQLCCVIRRTPEKCC